MFDDEILINILGAIEATSRKSLTTLIGIDGMAGSGKTTLAMQLHQHIPSSAIVSLDNFYLSMSACQFQCLNPERDYKSHFDWKRLRDSVLEPLIRNTRALYQQYDWSTNTYGDWLTVEPRRVVFLEGVYSTRRELRSYFNLTLYVETSLDTRYSRIINRKYKDISWLDRWIAMENWYESYEQPTEQADLIVQGD